MKGKVILRDDGNKQIGLGHIYRCIVIAEMLQDKFNRTFLLQGTSLIEIITQKFHRSKLPASIALHEESEWIKNNIGTEHTVVIVDGFHFHSGYQKSIKQHGFKLIYIDDLKKEHMFADVVTNHSPLFTAKQFKIGSSH